MNLIGLISLYLPDSAPRLVSVSLFSCTKSLVFKSTPSQGGETFREDGAVGFGRSFPP